MNAATPTLRCYAARCGKRVVPLQNVRRPAAGLRRHLHGTASSSSTSTANDLPRSGLLQLFGAAVVGATGALLLVRLRNAAVAQATTDDAVLTQTYPRQEPLRAEASTSTDKHRVKSAKRITGDELLKHNRRDDCWVCIDDVVYE